MHSNKESAKDPTVVSSMRSDAICVGIYISPVSSKSRNASSFSDTPYR